MIHRTQSVGYQTRFHPEVVIHTKKIVVDAANNAVISYGRLKRRVRHILEDSIELHSNQIDEYKIESIDFGHVRGPLRSLHCRNHTFDWEITNEGVWKNDDRYPLVQDVRINNVPF